jgi:hypothetical protein
VDSVANTGAFFEAVFFTAGEGAAAAAEGLGDLTAATAPGLTPRPCPVLAAPPGEGTGVSSPARWPNSSSVSKSSSSSFSSSVSSGSRFAAAAAAMMRRASSRVARSAASSPPSAWWEGKEGERGDCQSREGGFVLNAERPRFFWSEGQFFLGLLGREVLARSPSQGLPHP